MAKIDGRRVKFNETKCKVVETTNEPNKHTVWNACMYVLNVSFIHCIYTKQRKMGVDVFLRHFL